MKKVFAIAALAFSMSLVSCGGDKGAATASDSDSTKKGQNKVENNEGNTDTTVVIEEGTTNGGEMTADQLVEAIQSASTPEELAALEAQFKQLQGSLPAEAIAKINQIGQAKAQALMSAVGGDTDDLMKSANDAAAKMMQEANDAANEMMQSIPDGYDF